MRVLRTLTAIGGSVIALVLLLSLPVAAYAASDITISSPQSGGTIIDIASQISGTAPANTLIKISIIDAAPGRPNVKHIPGGKVSGSVTSDKNGQWVYVPSTLIPGQYTVNAYYVGAGNKHVNAPMAPFTVVDSKGNSVAPSVSTQRKIAIGLMAFAVLLFLYIFAVVRRNGGRFVSRQAEEIEHEIEHTHDELMALEKRLAKDEQDYDRERNKPKNSGQ